jgi:hypothetical protein
MTTLLDEAIARLKAMPEDQQDAAAVATLDLIATLEAEGDGALTQEEVSAIRAKLARPRIIASPEAVEAAFTPRASQPR